MVNNEPTMEYRKAIAYIYNQIIEGRLIAGSKIPPERELAENLGIGRNSTREAISILRGMGLVESVRGSGNYISKDCGRTIEYIISTMLAMGSISKKHLFDFRKSISETVGMYLIENSIDTEDREHIESILSKMDNVPTEDFAGLDMEFHQALIYATKNPLYILIVEPVARVYLTSVYEVIQNSDDNARRELAVIHRKIYESILAGDENTCREYMTKHYEIAWSRIAKESGS